ncbi:FUSC family protein [Flexibacterium corallicola]|uniref:FUSC family protein n=1 Tax=Flexibacterium corallicola TaxID=3037259 RepID=UPI00286F431B|nr:FUSC family protein [Pseudovibrio sp. M1P-2-3]
MDHREKIRPYFHHHEALRTAFIVTLGAFLALIVQANDPWWAAISAFTVSNADWRGFFAKAIQRTLGTVVGGLSGFAIAYALRDDPILQAVVLFVLSALSIYKNLTSYFGYAWLLGTATAMIPFYYSILDIEQMYEAMQDRIVTVCLGILAAAAVSVLLSPPHKWRASITMSHMDMGILPRRWVWRTSLSAGLVALTAPILFAGHDLGGMIQIVFTSLVCLAGDISSIRHIALSRFIGCAVGGSLGLLVVMMGIQYFPLWVLMFFVGMYMIAGWHHNGTRWAYAGTQAGFAFIVCVMTSSGPVDSIRPVLDRFNGIVIGISMTLLFMVLIGIAQGEAFLWWRRKTDPIDEK